MSRTLAPPTVAAVGTAGRTAIGVDRRGLLLLALGLLWLGPAWIDRRALVLLALWNVGVTAVWLADLRRLPAPGELRLQRRWDGPLGLGTPAVVQVEIANAGARAIVAEVTDDCAPVLRREVAGAALSVAPGGRAAFTYDVWPRERGDAAMGIVVVAYRSPWGVARRWAVAALGQTVRVHPNLREARRQALAVARSRQAAREVRRVHQPGKGREFDRLREFQDGDEQRDVCWTASARRGRLVTRVFQPERSQAVWVLVDAGRLLRAQSGPHRTLDHLANSALALAQAAMTAGDRVGLLAYGRQIQQRLVPGRGPHHLRALVDALASLRGEAVEADHAAAAAQLLALQRRRALVVWLTDIADTVGTPDVIEHGQRLAPRHVVVMAVPRQPALTALAAAEPVDAPALYRTLAAQLVVERRERLLAGLRQRGVLTIELPPGELSTALVNRYLAIKDRSLV